MAAQTRFADYLPAVLRQPGSDGTAFLDAFLSSFEAVFNRIQNELDTIPELFALHPTPTLTAFAGNTTDQLPLDSAAGLCLGDYLRIDSDLTRLEFGTVKEIQEASAGLIPTTVILNQPLRFDHD